MKFLTPKTAVALASTLVLAACGGSSTVSNNGGFDNFPTFGGLAGEGNVLGSLQKFDDLNSEPLETTPPVGNLNGFAFFDSAEGVVFRVGDGTTGDTLYLGALSIGWDIVFDEIDGDINSIILATDRSDVAGSLDIDLVSINNGFFNSTFTGTATFDGFTGAIEGQFKEFGGENYFVVVFSGDDGVDDLEGLGTTDCFEGC